MKVLMIAQYFPPDFGGASTRAYNAARGLVLQGCEVTVISAFPHYPHGIIPDKYGKRFITIEEVDDIKLIRTWIPRLSHSSVAKRILLHLSFMLSSLLAFRFVRKPDIIFAMNPNLFSFFPSYIYSKVFRKNIIRNVDDLWPEVFYDLGIVKSNLVKKILDYLARISYHVPSIIVPVSYGYVKVLAEKYQIPSQKISVVEHGVDTSKFHNLEVDTPIGYNGKKIVMYSGALNLGYDFETVIKAAQLIAHQPVQFIIRGTGELSEHLRHMVSEHKVGNVEIRTELLNKEELVLFMNQADMFLLPMSSVGIIDLGFPTKILE